MNKIISKNKEQLDSIFKNHSLKRVYLFGSSLNSNFNSKSDIDLLLNFEDNLDDLKRGELIWSLYDQLKNLFNREIDLVNEKYLKNPYLIKEINSSKELIYG